MFIIFAMVNKKITKGGSVMPRGDGTGPNGMGPMTGRRAGYCAGYGVPGYLNDVPVRGRGFGYGYGWGYGRGYGRGYGYRWGAAYQGVPYYAEPLTPERETTFLENELRLLEQREKDLQKRLEELRKEDRTTNGE